MCVCYFNFILVLSTKVFNLHFIKEKLKKKHLCVCLHVHTSTYVWIAACEVVMEWMVVGLHNCLCCLYSIYLDIQSKENK